MQTKHIVGNPSTPIWQHDSDGAGILSVESSIGICSNKTKIKRVKWKQMEKGQKRHIGY